MIDLRDVRIDICATSPAISVGEVEIILTYEPTGQSVSGKGKSTYLLKEKLLYRLDQKVLWGTGGDSI
ncbi:MAG: hypothetical protein JKY22_11990 [Flavobacteriaceae bacterium]|nr:hypothetical protein [Flavobacteriaceae bacterium]PCJ26468.1 MAG: hypothetical protein COA94_05005 [Rickettsiales bacterium]